MRVIHLLGSDSNEFDFRSSHVLATNCDLRTPRRLVSKDEYLYLTCVPALGEKGANSKPTKSPVYLFQTESQFRSMGVDDFFILSNEDQLPYPEYSSLTSESGDFLFLIKRGAKEETLIRILKHTLAFKNAHEGKEKVVIVNHMKESSQSHEYTGTVNTKRALEEAGGFAFVGGKFNGNRLIFSNNCDAILQDCGGRDIIAGCVQIGSTVVPIPIKMEKLRQNLKNTTSRHVNESTSTPGKSTTVLPNTQDYSTVLRLLHGIDVENSEDFHKSSYSIAASTRSTSVTDNEEESIIDSSSQSLLSRASYSYHPVSISETLNQCLDQSVLWNHVVSNNKNYSLFHFRISSEGLPYFIGDYSDYERTATWNFTPNCLISRMINSCNTNYDHGIGNRLEAEKSESAPGTLLGLTWTEIGTQIWEREAKVLSRIQWKSENEILKIP